MIQPPEIASDTEELAATAIRLQSQADALDAALAGIDSLPAQVQSQAQTFIAEHAPKAVYAAKLTELGKLNGSVKSAITALAAKLRAQATGLTSHASRTAEQQQDSAQQVDKIDPSVTV